MFLIPKNVTSWMVEEGLTLGYIISRKGIEIDLANIDVITQLPYLL